VISELQKEKGNDCTEVNRISFYDLFAETISDLKYTDHRLELSYDWYLGKLCIVVDSFFCDY
jgi:hypothetical protein